MRRMNESLVRSPGRGELAEMALLALSRWERRRVELWPSMASALALALTPGKVGLFAAIAEASAPAGRLGFSGDGGQVRGVRKYQTLRATIEALARGRRSDPWGKAIEGPELSGIAQGRLA